MNRKKNLILGVFLLLCCSNVFACSCIGKYTVEQALKRMDVVFLGKVISKEMIVVPNPHSMYNTCYYKYVFKLEKMYKGRKTSYIEIVTGHGNGDCGYKFEEGKDYIVYAYKENRYNNSSPKTATYFRTSVCNRTTANIEVEKKEIEKYRKGRVARR